ncbi:MAG: hypothetical protein F6K54_32680 [Okeania sp. SIO3B5]|uniref:hypothetical protein n=1 Tax=Okeania sp. SIO3B5 TaxID=2607811 RepID=UPI0013FF3139|nr:hypothetical protein [Okeania sp. SIO3B5]NEO57418.1 hypothetical protein [Okeania sp. SIO3B5]
MLQGQINQYLLLFQSAGIETAERYRAAVEAPTYRDRPNRSGFTQWRSTKTRDAAYMRHYRQARWGSKFGDYGNKRPT